MKTYWLYILECRDGSLYTGVATDVRRRFREHRAGTGAKYTRSHKPVRIVYTKSFKNRGRAQSRETEIKSWPRTKKLELIKNKGG